MIHEELAAPQRSCRHSLVISTAIAGLLLASIPAVGQTTSATSLAGVPTVPFEGFSNSQASQDAGLISTASPPQPSPTNATSPLTANATTAANGPTPPFLIGATVGLSEGYVSNAAGTSNGSQADYLTQFTLTTSLHERTRIFSLDGNYTGSVYAYANGTVPTQFSNDLHAVSTLIAIPDYLTFSAKAFAQPVIDSAVGIVTAGNIPVSNGYSNSYGYYVGPDFRFRLGDFATSETTASYGGAYFTAAQGSSNVPVIPGIPGPEDTISRVASEKLSSGEDFSRLNWAAVGLLSETDQSQGLLSEKAGVGNFAYAITREFSLLATAGYDAVSNTTPLLKNVSGPVWMGGIGLNFGPDFSLQVEGGRKYNGSSFYGNLRYNLTPRAALVGSANDYIQTPEGQLLNGLTNLTSTPNGSLGPSQDLLPDGSFSSLSAFSAQPLGSSTFDQNIARYQVAMLSLVDDFDRNNATISTFASRRTILSGVFIGSPIQDSWGGQVRLSRNLTPLLTGSLGAGYTFDQQYGGDGRTTNIDGQLSYSLSRASKVYFSADYANRDSSAALQRLSPLTGSVSDFSLILGINRVL